MKDLEILDGLAKKAKEIANTLLEVKGWSLCFEAVILKSEGSEKENIKPIVAIEFRKRFRSMPQFHRAGLDEYFIWTVLDFRDFEFRPTISNQKEEQERMDSLLQGFLNTNLFQLFSGGRSFIEILEYAQRLNFAHVDHIDITDFFSLKKIKLTGLKHSNEIYFMGENGDGKSLILAAMHLAFGGAGILGKYKAQQVGAALDMLKAAESNELVAKDSHQFKYGSSSKNWIQNFFAYGANRGLYSSDQFDETGFMSLYTNDTYLFSPERLLELAVTGEMARESQGSSGRIPVIGKIASKDIIRLFEDLLDGNVKIKPDSIDWFVFDEKGFKVPFRNLSEGYKNLLIWIADLLMRLQKNNPEIENIADFRGVVMVDEIDLHLHPLWQLRLAGKLRQYFPNIQFIFTTHSPIMLQGAGDDAVIYRAFRNTETGVTEVSEPYYKREMTHMMFNTLMTSPLFGLESARISPETEDPDTSDSFLNSRVAHAVKMKLREQKAGGKTFISETEIDALIEDALNEELSK